MRFLLRNGGQQVRPVEINFIAPDFAFGVKLDETDADDLQCGASHGNPGQPLVEKTVLQRNALDLRPDPVEIKILE